MRTDPALDGVIGAVVLFTTEPTDRALAGWNPHEWLEIELDQLQEWATCAG